MVYLTHILEDKGINTFPKGICPKVKVIARLEFEVVYNDSAVHCFIHYTTRTHPTLKRKNHTERRKAKLSWISPSTRRLICLYHFTRYQCNVILRAKVRKRWEVNFWGKENNNRKKQTPLKIVFPKLISSIKNSVFPSPAKDDIILRFTRTLAWWLECSPMARETWVQVQVESYQRLKKWYLMPPFSTLSIIRYGSRVNWSNPGKGVATSPTPCCNSYGKVSPLVTLDYTCQLYFFYILRSQFHSDWKEMAWILIV